MNSNQISYYFMKIYKNSCSYLYFFSICVTTYREKKLKDILYEQNINMWVFHNVREHFCPKSKK